MEQRELVERIYEHVEAGHVDKAVFACSRLAKKVGVVFSLVIFLRELYPDRHQFLVAFHEVTQHLNDEGRKFLIDRSADVWIQERTLDFGPDPEDEDRNVLAQGVGVLQHEADRLEKAINDLNVPRGMGENDTAAFADSYLRQKAAMRVSIKASRTILERIRTRCHHFASRVEAQLDSQARTEDVLGRLQGYVNSYFAARCESTFRRLTRAAALIDSTSPEDHALLLTSITRAVKSSADYWYPPATQEVTCHDGKQRTLGDAQYLNRLHEFCAQQFLGSTSDSLIRDELNLLARFVRRINEVASKGVHADVTQPEALQGLLSLYVFLFNVISKLEQKNEDTG